MIHDDVTGRVITAAISVHSALGAGMLESTYSACLFHEMTIGGLQFQHQVRLPVRYRGITLETGYRIDFLVEDCVIVEIKAVEKLLPLHTAQLITYLKLSGRQMGLLINFNVAHLRQGLKRVVNEYACPIGNLLPERGSSSDASLPSAVESQPALKHDPEQYNSASVSSASSAVESAVVESSLGRNKT